MTVISAGITILLMMQSASQTPAPAIPCSQSFSGQAFGFGGSPEGQLGGSSTHLAVDTIGNLFVADSLNARVVRVAPGEALSSIAGLGGQRMLGDGGPVRYVEPSPDGVAVDRGGNLYIADSWARVRKVTPSAVITNAAGGATLYGPLGQPVPGFSGDGGPAISGRVIAKEIAVDEAGNLYIAASGGCIRKVTPDGTIRTLIGKDTSASLGTLSGIAVDGSGNVYTTDSSGNRVFRVTPDGVVSVFAGSVRGFAGDGGGTASAEFNQPSSIAIDSAGNLYIADSGNFRIRKITPAGVISTVAGTGVSVIAGNTGPATDTPLSNPRGIAVDGAGNLYIADVRTILGAGGGGQVRILKVTPEGMLSTIVRATGNTNPRGQR